MASFLHPLLSDTCHTFFIGPFLLLLLILPPKKGPPWCTKRWGCPISSLSLKCVQDDCAHFLSRFEYFQVWKNLARVIWVKWNIFSFVPPALKKIAGGAPKIRGRIKWGHLLVHHGFNWDLMEHFTSKLLEDYFSFSLLSSKRDQGWWSIGQKIFWLQALISLRNMA